MPATRTENNESLYKGFTLDELEILLEISSIVTSNLDLDEILQSVHSHLPKLIQHKKSGIFFYHESSGKVTIHSNIGFSERLLKQFRENISSHFLFIKQLQTKRGWRSTDIYPVEEIKKLPYFQSALRRDGILYGIGAPILLDENFIGTIHVTRPESSGDFSIKDLRMLELICNQISIAFKNSITYEKDLKEKDDIITSLEQKVKQAERLAALGRAAAIIAHEVKNPLTSIRVSLYSIEKKNSWKMEISEDLNIVKEAVDRVSRTMEDLLHFSSDTYLRFEEIDLNEILKGLVSEYRDRHGKDFIIETSLSKPIPRTLADIEKLKEIFGNLLLNALAASESGGTVRVSTNHLFDQVVVTIEDWGCGIPSDIQQKIFEPFFTTKQSGTGLGLAIAKKNIEAHRGSIKVESEPGWGTKFMVILPVYNQARHGDSDE